MPGEQHGAKGPKWGQERAETAEQGFSGRTLRRLPVLAHAKMMDHSSPRAALTCLDWLLGLEDAIEDAREGQK